MLKNKFTFGKGNILPAVLALMVISFLALACGGSKPEMPNDATIQSLVKSTMTDFAEGVDKGDFKKLRDNSSTDFQNTFTEDQLKTLFKDYTAHKDVVSPILHSAAGMTPKFTSASSIREEKGNYILVTNGQFDTTPAAAKFNFEYVWRDNAWKLLTIKVNVE